MVPSGNKPEAVIPLETQFVRPSLTIESGWAPGPSSTALDLGSGAPAEALLAALRRAWRDAEGRRAASAGAIAPAGHVRPRGRHPPPRGGHARESRAAGRGASAGCAPGVARMVNVALARQVLEALPLPRRGSEPEPCGEGAEGGAGLPVGLGGARANVPPPSWWCREPSWTPRVVAEPQQRSGRDASGHALVGAMWPPVPDSPERPSPPRPATTRRSLGPDGALEAQALYILEAELQPEDWSMAPRCSLSRAMEHAR